MAVEPLPKASAATSPTGQNTPTLKRGAIGLVGVVFMVVAFSAPITAMTGNLPVAVGFGNGLGAPAAFIIATIVLTVFSVGFVALARHITAAGAFYTFVSRGWSKIPGLPAGVLPAFTYMTMEAGLIGIFSAFADQAMASQFGFDLPWEQRDLAGAIVFTKAAAGQRAMPTWQAARPLAFIATMLGDPRLTDDAEVAAELSRLLQSLRFLRQLTASEADGHMYRSPDRAVGGVRASLFDQRMPPEATSLTLIAVCETIRSLEQIESRRGAAGEAPPDPGARGDGAGG